MTVSVELALELLLRVGLGEAAHVSGEAAAQVSVTVPANPLTEAMLIGVVPVSAPPLTLTGMFVVWGTMVKSLKGFEIAVDSTAAEGL